MRWRAAVIGTLASIIVNGATSAEVRIVGDPGGEVSSYLRKFHAVRDFGQRVVIDGPCLSACTLLLVEVPEERICVTSRAVLGFHAAAYYDDASRSWCRRGVAARW